MNPILEPTLAELLIDLAAESPRSGLEFCQALQFHHGVVLRGREGAVYAALVQLEREGYLVGEFEETEDGRRRRRYRLPVLRDVGDRTAEPPSGEEEE
jgi:DNA-binding PadR family transcriptional regulator